MREWMGTGYVEPVAVHFVGVEDTIAGTLDLTVVQDSNSAILAEVVVEIDALVSLDPCGT